MAEVTARAKPFTGAPPKVEAFGGPKKPALGAYFLWANTVRQGIQDKMRAECEKEGKPFKVTEVALILANEFKTVSEEKKAEYKAESEVLKVKWSAEFEAWKLTPKYQEYLQCKSSTKEKKDMKDAKKAIKESGMPSKPPVAFMLFMAARREAVTADMRAKNAYRMQDVAGIVSKEWKELSEEKKEPYNAEAKVKKDAYEKELEAFKLTDTYKNYVTQQETIKATKNGTLKEQKKKLKEEAKEEAKKWKKTYIVQKPINLTSELSSDSTVIRSIEANEKIESLEEPSEEGERTRVKCKALKDKALGFVTIKEGETEYLTEQAPRKPKAPKKTETASEVEGDEDTKETEEKPKKKRGPKAKTTEGDEPAKKKPRAMKTATTPKDDAPVATEGEKDATMEVAA